MEAMIDNGEEWLQPMLDMRDWLAETQIPENKPKIRDHRRRNGRVEYFDAQGEQRIIWGPYKFEFRQEILRRLLKTQKEVRLNGPDPKLNLIYPDELHKIRQLWLHEEGDWEDSLPKLYQEETGEAMDWLIDDQAGVGGIEQRLLEEASREADLPDGLLQQLFDVERSHQGMTRRLGIYDKLDDVLSKNWETLEEALSKTQNQPGLEP